MPYRFVYDLQLAFNKLMHRLVYTDTLDHELSVDFLFSLLLWPIPGRLLLHGGKLGSGTPHQAHLDQFGEHQHNFCVCFPDHAIEIVRGFFQWTLGSNISLWHDALQKVSKHTVDLRSPSWH